MLPSVVNDPSPMSSDLNESYQEPSLLDHTIYGSQLGVDVSCIWWACLRGDMSAVLASVFFVFCRLCSMRVTWTGLETMDGRVESLLVCWCVQDSQHKLYHLLPPLLVSNYTQRGLDKNTMCHCIPHSSLWENSNSIRSHSLELLTAIHGHHSCRRFIWF